MPACILEIPGIPGHIMDFFHIFYSPIIDLVCEEESETSKLAIIVGKNCEHV